MVHLHVHSNHSFLEGPIPIRALVARAVEYGMKTLALTDTAGMYGVIPFYKAAQEAGIRPIIGTKLDNTVLLARDREGYATLCRLVTAWHLEEKFTLTEALRPEQHLFVLSGDETLIRALHAKGLKPLVAVCNYGDRPSRYAAARMRALAQGMKLRALAVNPVYLLEPRGYDLHRVLAAIRCNTILDGLEPGDTADRRDWFRSPEEMEALYRDWPETLTNTEWVAERCDVPLTFGKPLFPAMDLPPGETPFSFLWKCAFEGLKNRYRPLRPEILRRFQTELEVIDKLGFAPYFLIVNDIVQYAKAHQIPIVGRGSAANSLVSYALGITRVDPFKYDLYFERFLHLSRSDCPDIDLDICWRRRDKVIEYVYDRYGADRVAMICTFNTFRARAAIREVARVHGYTPQEVGEITRYLPHYHASDLRTVARLLPEAKHLRFDEEPLSSVVAMSERLDNYPRHLSIHSGGLVIAPCPLTEFVPLQRATKGILITQYDMGPIESLGLIKMDLLGHRSLTVIDDTVKKIKENRGIELDVEKLPEPDPLTGGMIRAGQTIGCFQIESPAMRALLQQTQADDTDMLIKTLSLVRPGPSGSGMKQTFIARHLGKEAVEHIHPLLGEVLKDTYGVMLYQEDILKVASAIAGMSLEEGDMLRRAMTKKRTPKEMAKSMKTFIEKAIASGVEPTVAEEIWERIANFAKYSYCKAHASTYGELSYQCTYLKAHFPAEFLSSVLTNRGGFYHPAVYLEEAKRFGITILPPDVNHSYFHYSVEGEAIRTGFVEVRNLNLTAVKAIIEGRKQQSYTSFAEFCRRTGIAYADAELLIHCGACDRLAETRPALLWELKLLGKNGMGGDKDARLFTEENTVNRLTPKVPGYTRKRHTDQSWQTLGLLPETHPLEYYLPLLTEHTLVLSSDMPWYPHQLITLVGWLIAERRVAVADRGAMKFLTLEDPGGVYEAVLFPETYQRFGHLLDSQGPFLVAGEVQQEGHYHSLMIESIVVLGHEAKAVGYNEVTPPKSWLLPAFNAANRQE